MPSDPRAQPEPEPEPRPQPEPAVEPDGQPDPDAEPEPGSVAATDSTGAPSTQELPPRLVAIGYLIAAVCALVPLAVLGAAFAGTVLFTHGRRGAGAGVIALAVICTALGATVLR
ncbi:MAG TPA: hypothetical protein VHZ31_03255 [Solirubrobacteraceae bacterium]|nr:hypothetical protein [Solirubrobacteraceae bacterium]